MTVSSLGVPEPGEAIARLLERPRYEVVTLPGTADLVEEHLPAGATVTVTVGRRGLDACLDLSVDLGGRGFAAVPHLTARQVRDRRHLDEVLERLREAGIDEAFVIGGDASPPAGEFDDATGLLRALDGRVRTLGVAGYPEGHPHITDGELDRALRSKRPLCHYAVTQMCFDVAAVDRWIGHARSLGFHHPVHVGVPGAVASLRLAKVATRIGVGPSLRFARIQHGLGRLLRPGGYRPDHLVGDLTACPVAGLHLYTLGDVAATERWRRSLLERLGHG